MTLGEGDIWRGAAMRASKAGKSGRGGELRTVGPASGERRDHGQLGRKGEATFSERSRQRAGVWRSRSCRRRSWGLVSRSDMASDGGGGKKERRRQASERAREQWDDGLKGGSREWSIRLGVVCRTAPLAGWQASE